MMVMGVTLLYIRDENKCVLEYTVALSLYNGRRVTRGFSNITMAVLSVLH